MEALIAKNEVTIHSPQAWFSILLFFKNLKIIHITLIVFVNYDYYTLLAEYLFQ